MTSRGRVAQESVKEKEMCFISSMQTCLCSEIRNLTYLADNVDISVCVYDYLTYFFRVCRMYLLKVRTMWLIRPVIGNGNKTLTSLSERLSLCVCVWVSECVCYLLTCDTLAGCCELRVREAVVPLVSLIASEPFWGAVYPQYEWLSVGVGHV